MRPSTAAILSVLFVLRSTHAQTADGAIVPFSTLPTCATLCGPLFDVQGKCSPPNIATVDDNCFCIDSRLTPFNTGAAGVIQACKSTTPCSDSDAQAIQSWYKNFCSTKGAVASTTTAGGAASTSTGTNTPKSSSGNSNSGPPSWLSTHYKWVIMLVVVVFFIVGAWIAACLLRSRHLRRKEKEIEMLPPVALGPHQLQAMTGGFRYGDEVVDANRGVQNQGGGHHNEMVSVEAANVPRTERQSRSLKKKIQR